MRLTNLVAVLHELRVEGIEGFVSQAEFLGLSTLALADTMVGGEITDEIARNIEWSANKPHLWLDDDHSADPLA
ncbi:hypothetical protein KPL74_20935 [Bacillus sp. NP157]|nr:hypothetical protein KPL74_20935 [Bacillus sp. NP157]